MFYVVPENINCTITRVAIGPLQSLQCNLLDTGNQNLNILNWKYESKNIAAGSLDYDVFIETAKGVLIFKNSSKDLSGSYKCIIGNTKHKSFCQFNVGK